jgi:hypothetical protein
MQLAESLGGGPSAARPQFLDQILKLPFYSLAHIAELEAEQCVRPEGSRPCQDSKPNAVDFKTQFHLLIDLKRHRLT